MAYSKQTWATGDTITAAKLNYMEDGIGSGLTNLVLSGESAPENSRVKETSSGTGISGSYILITDSQIGEFVFTSTETDGVVSYFPIQSVSVLNVSPVTNEQDAAYTISEAMDGLMVMFEGGGLLVLPTSTEWVEVGA